LVLDFRYRPMRVCPPMTTSCLIILRLSLSVTGNYACSQQPSTGKMKDKCPLIKKIRHFLAQRQGKLK
jgi:hypothetical protein